MASASSGSSDEVHGESFVMKRAFGQTNYTNNVVTHQYSRSVVPGPVSARVTFTKTLGSTCLNRWSADACRHRKGFRDCCCCPPPAEHCHSTVMEPFQRQGHAGKVNCNHGEVMCGLGGATAVSNTGSMLTSANHLLSRANYTAHLVHFKSSERVSTRTTSHSFAPRESRFRGDATVQQCPDFFWKVIYRWSTSDVWFAHS